ncbi:MAG: hypothetical protein NVS4B6_30090 [Mycobacterium sp.]
MYSTDPALWRPGDDSVVQTRLDEEPGVSTARHGEGWMTVQTYTVRHTDDGLIGVVVGLLEASGKRTVATTTADDALAMLIDGEPVGQRLYLQRADVGNSATLGPTRSS